MIIFSSTGKLTNVESGATTICKIEDNQYEIEFGTDGYFRCENCSDKISYEIKEVVDFNDIDDSMKNIEEYFKSKNGSCE